jgi:predicted N-acetyltransferase YhbS
MQVRAGTRQDEPIIRTIIFQALEEHGIQPDLEGRDSDLRNIEHSYFWYDGLCIVAERDGQIIGVLAARRQGDDEKTLELLRLAVTPGARKRGVARSLVKTMRFFAGNMGYEKIVIGKDSRSELLKKVSAVVLEKLGFSQNHEIDCWLSNVTDKCASSA